MCGVAIVAVVSLGGGAETPPASEPRSLRAVLARANALLAEGATAAEVRLLPEMVEPVEVWLPIRRVLTDDGSEGGVSLLCEVVLGELPKERYFSSTERRAAGALRKEAEWHETLAAQAVARGARATQLAGATRGELRRLYANVARRKAEYEQAQVVVVAPWDPRWRTRTHFHGTVKITDVRCGGESSDPPLPPRVKRIACEVVPGPATAPASAPSAASFQESATSVKSAESRSATDSTDGHRL